MPSRNTVAPAGAAAKVRLTFCGKMVTELVDCSPLESVTVRLTRYRVKSLKSCPEVGIVNVPLVTPVMGVPGCT